MNGGNNNYNVWNIPHAELHWMNGKLERSLPHRMPYLGVSPLLFHFSESFFIASLRCWKIMNCDEILYVFFSSLIARYTFFHLPIELEAADKKKRFLTSATASVSGVPQRSRQNSAVFVFMAIASRQIIPRQSRAQMIHFLSPPSQPRDLINRSNNLTDNLIFQFTTINQFPANRHQRETNCSRRTKRRFEVGVGRQILQVNIIILHFFPTRSFSSLFSICLLKLFSNYYLNRLKCGRISLRWLFSLSA